MSEDTHGINKDAFLAVLGGLTMEQIDALVMLFIVTAAHDHLTLCHLSRHGASRMTGMELSDYCTRFAQGTIAARDKLLS